MSLQEILSECARLAQGGGAGALASVARRKGSLPMSASAKMLVTADGARMGTVGGGCLEAEITERALDVIERRVPIITEHTLNSELAGDYGLTCGGTAVMFIEPVFTDETLASVYRAALQLLAAGGRGVLATSLDWSDVPRKALMVDGATTGHASSAMLRQLESFPAVSEVQTLEDGILAEPVAGAPRLVVFGGGHVGARVSQAAHFAGWKVTVVDDREEFASASRHPIAERTFVCDFAELPGALHIDENTYVVIATRGHQHDALVAEQVVRGNARYVGMLGSRRKVQLTWQLLRSQGIDGARLDAVHAPVGLSIGADTPEEIAISVVAEMIAVRRADSRRRGGVAGTGTLSNTESGGGDGATAVV